MKIPDFNSRKFLVAKKQHFLELTENRTTLREIKFVTRKCPFHLAFLAEFPKFWANRFPFWKFNNLRRDFQETRRLTYIVNSVDKTKLSCNTPTDAAPQFL